MEFPCELWDSPATPENATLGILCVLDRTRSGPLLTGCFCPVDSEAQNLGFWRRFLGFCTLSSSVTSCQFAHFGFSATITLARLSIRFSESRRWTKLAFFSFFFLLFFLEIVSGEVSFHFPRSKFELRKLINGDFSLLRLLGRLLFGWLCCVFESPQQCQHI